MMKSISDAGAATLSQPDLRQAIAGIARVMTRDAANHADLADGLLLLAESLVELEHVDDIDRYTAIGKRSFAKLEEQNRRKRAEGEALRAEISRVAQECKPPITARRLMPLISLDRIGRTSLPAERTVQWHLARLR